MKTMLLATLPIIALACVDLAPAPGQVLPKRWVRVELVIYGGDPRGSRQAGTVEILSRPTMDTQDNQTAHHIVGQSFPIPDGCGGMKYVDVGVEVLVKPRRVGEGKLRLDIQVSHSSVGYVLGVPVIWGKTSRIVGTFKFGEKGRIPAAGTGADQIWGEFLAEEVIK